MQTSGTQVPVVVGFDFSPLAELALREVAAMAADRPDIVIHMVNARSDAARHPVSRTTGGDVSQEIDEAMRAGARQALHDHGAVEGVQIVTHALIGDPAHVIVDIAGDVDAELIVVGSHGRRGIKRLVLGSVAEQVMRAAGCPVLVMRPLRRDPHPEMVPEPPCPECVEARERTAGATWWCAVHDKPWVPAHRYSYLGGDVRPYHPDGL